MRYETSVIEGSVMQFIPSRLPFPRRAVLSDAPSYAEYVRPPATVYAGRVGNCCPT